MNAHRSAGAASVDSTRQVLTRGNTRLHRVEENLGAAGVRLDADDLRDIEQGSAGIAIEAAS